MTSHRLDSVNFERLLSFRPKLNGQLAFEQPTLRDMAFDYYCKKYGDTERANEATKEYLDVIAGRFSGPTAGEEQAFMAREYRHAGERFE